MGTILNFQTEVHDGIEVVGRGRLCRLIRIVQDEYVCSAGPQDPGERGCQGARTPELANGQTLAPEVGVALAEAVQLTHLRYRGSPGRPAQELEECLDSLGSGYSVDGQAGVPLEVAECAGGVRAEDPVDPTCVEPETAEAELEVGYVVAPKHWSVQVEVAVPQADPCLHEGGLGGLVHRAVLIQAPFGLKCQERPGRIRPEVVGGHLDGIHRMADGQETTVEVRDGCPVVAGSDWF